MRALKGGVNGQHQGGRFLESELFTEAPSEPPRLQNCRPSAVCDGAEVLDEEIRGNAEE